MPPSIDALIDSIAFQFVLIVLLAITYGYLIHAVIRNHSVSAWDAPLGHWVGSRSTPVLDRVFSAVTQMGTYQFIRLGVVVVGLLLIFERDWPRLLMLGGLFATTMLVNRYLKQAITRPRPKLPERFSNLLKDYSFPSGHTMLATAFYLMVGYLGWAYSHETTLGFATMGLAVLLAILIGLSRVYLGVHFMTDVLGGWLAGGLLFSIMLLLSNLIFYSLRIA